MTISVSHIRRQHTVGQGGFHSALVEADFGGTKFRYDYIYDCGALAAGRRAAALDRQIKCYRPRQHDRHNYVVDALILSHFDRDHMNGAEQITSGFRVERILLPALTPEHLALEIARQAKQLSQAHLEALFDVAHGATLWGVPVVRVVQGTGDRTQAPDLNNPDSEDSEDGVDPNTRGAEGVPAFPRPLVAVDTTGAPLGDQLNHTEEIRLQGPARPVWRFKFWNQKVSDELTVLVLSAMESIGFPIQALEMVNGAKDITSWLKNKMNRDLLIEAYRHAHETYEEKPLKGNPNSGFANYVSMVMFSGPLDHVKDAQFRASGANCTPHPYHYAWLWHPDGFDDGPVGWIGTGDAMLGEPDIWREFEAHFKKELPLTRTILLPHHGAAPIGGARFYNPSLSENRRINVISYGARNTYGHPATSVLDQLVMSDVMYVRVTEDDCVYFEYVRCRY